MVFARIWVHSHASKPAKPVSSDLPVPHSQIYGVLVSPVIQQRQNASEFRFRDSVRVSLLDSDFAPKRSDNAVAPQAEREKICPVVERPVLEARREWWPTAFPSVIVDHHSTGGQLVASGTRRHTRTGTTAHVRRP